MLQTGGERGMDERAVEFLLPRMESLVTAILVYREGRNLLDAPLAHFLMHVPFFAEATRSFVLNCQAESPLQLSCSEALKSLRPHTTLDRSHVIESFLRFVTNTREKLRSLGAGIDVVPYLPAVQYLEVAVAFWRSRCAASELDSGGAEGNPLPKRTPMDAVVAIFAKGCQLLFEGLSGPYRATDAVVVTLAELDDAVSLLERKEEMVMRNKFFGTTYANTHIADTTGAVNNGTSPSRRSVGFYRRKGQGRKLVEATKGYILRAQAQLVAGMQAAVHESVQHETAVSDATVRSVATAMRPFSATAHREAEGQRTTTPSAPALGSEGLGRPRSASSNTTHQRPETSTASDFQTATAAQGDSRPSTPLHGSVRVRPVSAGAGSPRPSAAAERRRKWALRRKEALDSVSADVQRESARVMRATERVAKVSVSPACHGSGDALLKACAEAQVEALRTFRNAQTRMERARGSALQSIRALTKQWQATEPSHETAEHNANCNTSTPSTLVAAYHRGATSTAPTRDSSSPFPGHRRPWSALPVASRVHGRTLPPEITEERLTAFVAEATGSRYPGAPPVGVKDYSAQVKDQRARNVRKLLNTLREDHRLVRVRLSPWRVTKDPETERLCPQRYATRHNDTADGSRALSKLREWNAAHRAAASDPTLLGERAHSAVRYYFVENTTGPHDQAPDAPQLQAAPGAGSVPSGAFADLTRLMS